MNCLYCNHSFDEKLGYCPDCGALMCKEYVLNKSMSQSKWIFKKRFKRSSYMDEVLQWQEHQYDPGYYTGGRLPPFYRKPGNTTLFTWTIYIICAIILISFIVSLFESII